MAQDRTERKLDIQIELDEQTAQGTYCNLAFITHSASEFVMDFIFVQPQEPRGKIRARIITSPQHAKGFLQALVENVERYENSFGAIRTQEPFPSKPTFVS